jgi:ribosomal protein L7/L12
MKLDKMQFARLVAHCVGNGMNAGTYEVEELDRIIDFDVPEPKVISAKASDIDNLLMLMAEGTRKIEAIKAYRSLTGEGLKEAKDAVERYWMSKPIE